MFQTNTNQVSRWGIVDTSLHHPLSPLTSPHPLLSPYPSCVVTPRPHPHFSPVHAPYLAYGQNTPAPCSPMTVLAFRDYPFNEKSDFA